MRGMALMASFLFVACNPNRALDTRTYDSIQVMERAVDKAIEDPDRAEQTKATLQEAEASIKDFYDDLAKLRAEAYELARTYDSTEADFEKVLDRTKLLRRRHRDLLIGLAMKARTSTTEAEWGEITGALLEKRMLKR